MAQVLNKRSDQVSLSGVPVAPSSSQLSYGELAINYADGAETLFIKNSDNEIASFSNDNALLNYIDNKSTARIYYGTCSTTANTYAKSATVETFPLDENNKPLVGTVVGIKFTVTNTYKTSGHTYSLNVNNTGIYSMYYNNAALATSTSANTLVAGYANRYVFYMFDGTYWVFLSASYDANSTYSSMTQVEINDGTGTTARLITPKMLRDNFYTEDEVDDLLDTKANAEDLADVATSGSYNDLEDKPSIPTVPTNVSAFTNDSGYLTSHQDISGKANSADLATVATSGSYTDLIDAPQYVLCTLTQYNAMQSHDSDTYYLILAESTI